MPRASAPLIALMRLRERLRAIIFLILISVLCTRVSANMTLEAMEESLQFYNEHKFLIDSTQIISKIMELAFFVFVIVIPIIIIYKKVKLKNNPNDRNKYIIKTQGLAELLFVFNIFISYCAEIVKYGSESTLYSNIFIIIVSLVNIGIILFKLLKKR